MDSLVIALKHLILKYVIMTKCETTESTSKIHIGKKSLGHSKHCTYVLFKKSDLDKEWPWACIITATYFVVQSMYHITLQDTPRYLLFGCDVILNAPFVYYWEVIRWCTQEILDKITGMNIVWFDKYTWLAPMSLFLHLSPTHI